MFRPLEAIVRSKFGYQGGGIKFKVANGTGRGRWRAEISFFQMYYMGTLAIIHLEERDLGPPSTPTRTVSYLKLDSPSLISEF